METAMGEKTNRLAGRLRDKLGDIFDGRISEIIREARDEALGLEHEDLNLTLGPLGDLM
jgi:hypothetical protein